MGTDFRYSLINTFRTIDQWRNAILFNFNGTQVSAFKRLDPDIELNLTVGNLSPGSLGSQNRGAVAQRQVPNAELKLNGSRFAFSQGPVQARTNEPTTLAMRGDGFFAVAESLNPGARVFLTRNGEFTWKETDQQDPRFQNNVDPNNPNPFKRYNLVNAQGLYVLRAQDIDPTTMRVKPPAGEPAGMLVEGRAAVYNGTNLVAPGQWNLRDAGPAFDPNVNPTNNPDNVTAHLNPQWSPTDLGSQFQLWGIPQFIKNVAGAQNQNNAALPDPTDPNSLNQQQGAVNRNDIAASSSTARLGSSLAVVQVPLKDGLTSSSFGGTVYDMNLTARVGITIQRYDDRVATDGNFRTSSFGAEQTDTTTLLRDMQDQSDRSVELFKNLNQMLQDFNSNLDQLFGLIK